jgi:hypothetical protein
MPGQGHLLALADPLDELGQLLLDARAIRLVA